MIYRGAHLYFFIMWLVNKKLKCFKFYIKFIGSEFSLSIFSPFQIRFKYNTTKKFVPIPFVKIISYTVINHCISDLI